VPTTSTGLARLTISSPQRRVDVALPDGVPLAELLPEVLAHAGTDLADAGEAHGGWLLRRADGVALAAGDPLAAQGVRDGDLLYLVPAQADWPEPEYDDVVEAIAAGARRYGSVWGATATRVTGIAVAGLALAIGLVGVLRSGLPAAVPLGVAVLLLVAGALAARAYGVAPVAVGLAGCALPYAFAGGMLVVAPRPGAPSLLVASVAVLVAALAGAIGVGLAPRLFVGAAGAGLLGAAGALVALFTSAAGAAAVLLTVLVTGVAAVPLLAIRLGRLPMPAPGLTDSALPDRQAVYAAVARTEEVLTGLLLAVAAAGVGASAVLARSGGVAGRLLVVVASAAFLLRARLFVPVRQRLPLLGAGVLGYAVMAWVTLAGTGAPGVATLVTLAVLVAIASIRYAGQPVSPYLGRAADLVDGVCVVSVLPIACAVLGLYAHVRALMG
jgi:type VII secretion integral membrane protein EccD